MAKFLQLTKELNESLKLSKLQVKGKLSLVTRMSLV